MDTPIGSFAPKLELLGEHTDPKAMDEALRRSMKLGYTTIPEFMIFSGLRRDSAKTYLESLCKGEHPRLWKVRESRRWLYFPAKDSSTE